MGTHLLKVLGLVCFLGLSSVILFRMVGKGSEGEGASEALVDYKAPDFRALSFQVEGEESFVELSDFQGQPLVLSFWASWCGVCREEGVYLKMKKHRLEQEGDLGEARFLRIAVSDSYENVKQYWTSEKDSLETAFDKSGLIAVDYGLTGVPETFFINPDGVIVYRHRGPLTEEIFDQYFEVITEETETFASQSPLSER